MEDNSVAVSGCPPSLNQRKLQLILEERIGHNSVKNTERKGGIIVVTFKDAQGLQKFHASEWEIDFGGKKHKLVVENDPRTGPQQPDCKAIDMQRDADSWRRKLFVSKIPNNLQNRSVFKSYFQRFGTVEKCYLKDDGSYAYLNFSNHAEALNAKRMAKDAGSSHYLQIQWDFKEVQPAKGQCRQWKTDNRPQTGSQTAPSSEHSGRQARPQTTSDRLDCRAKPVSSPRKPKLRTTTNEPQTTNEDASSRIVHHWNSLEELPAPGNTVCVLAQGIDPSASMQKIKMHFESKKRSNGGPVKRIVTMVDGLLIVFEDSKDCESCLKMENQKIDERVLKIYAKKIPTFFEKIFVVQGVGSGTTSDTLLMFLESCSPNETSPLSCKKTGIAGVYLVEYGDDFDQAEADGILKKVESQSLEGNPLEALRLLRTDCIKVTGVQNDVSNDAIKLKFESKKRSNGGPVTRIDRMKDEAVLVYFAAYTDAEGVHDWFKRPSAERLILGQQPADVELYFHALASDHESIVKDVVSTSSAVEISEYEATCDVELLNFFKSKEKHYSKLKERFDGTAFVQIYTKSVKFVPEKDSVFQSQDHFNTRCSDIFKAFLSEYTTTNYTTDAAKLQKARSFTPALFLQKDFKGDRFNVDVSWKNNSVSITGVKDLVDQMLQRIKNSLDFSKGTIPVNARQYWVMQACGIIEELKQKYKNVAIRCNDQLQSIDIIGQETDIHSVQIEALTVLNTVEKKNLSALDNIVLEFLSDTLKDSPEVQSTIRDILKMEKVNAAITLDETNPCLFVRSDSDYKNAIAVITNAIKIEKIKTDASTSVVLSSPQWKTFLQGLHGPSRVYVKQTKCIVMVGLEREIKGLTKKISEFLDENTVQRRCVNLSYGTARYIVERSVEFSEASCMKKDISCGLTAENGGGVFLEGKRKALGNACSEMKQLEKTIRERAYELKEPGIKRYYEKQEGKDFLKTMEGANDCIILISSRTCEEWEREKRRQAERVPLTPSTPVNQETLLTSVNLPNGKVSLQVWEANLIKHNCDVMVNASNVEMKLLTGGISGAIREFDERNGHFIQKEMTKLINANHGNFLPGDATITSAGNLPACKKIVHAVGPKWNLTPEKEASRELKTCVLKSLQETAKARLTSIALPAISCGISGGKIKICVPLIVETVIKYFKDESNSSIERVDFVENAKSEILDEFKTCVEKHGTAENKDEPKQSIPPSQSSAPQMVSSSSPAVKVVQGDIANTQADVVVNVSSSHGVHNMQGSAVSRALLNHAGSFILVNTHVVVNTLARKVHSLLVHSFFGQILDKVVFFRRR